jgi:hypothetical protein
MRSILYGNFGIEISDTVGGRVERVGRPSGPRR